MNNYYRIPSDNRDLNYEQYFNEGSPGISDYEDYTSHNTKRLDVSEIKQLLLSLKYLQQQINSIVKN